MTWTAAGETVEDPETGYPMPGGTGEAKAVPCRFHLGGIKVFKNQDSTESNQVGTIRVDAGSDTPMVNQIIDIPGQFNGPVRQIYHGQLTWRLEV